MREAMVLRFGRYVEKVFGLSSLLGGLRDSRKKPQIRTSTIFLSGLFSFVFRCLSLNALGVLLRIPGRFASLLGQRVPSVDRIGDVFALIVSESVRSILTQCGQRLGRNKALESPWRTRWGVIDGHEFFSQPEAALQQLPHSHGQSSRPRGHRILPLRRGLLPHSRMDRSPP